MRASNLDTISERSMSLHSYQKGYKLREDKKKYIYRHFDSLKAMFHYYYDHGNLLQTESNNDSELYDLEYLDNSKYHGQANIDEHRGILIKEGKGLFERKSKNNHSFY